MKRLFVAVTLTLPLALAGGCLAAQPLLTPDARVSLVTVSPGRELYSGFGHSALRIQDPKLGLDYVFNYGTFDFETEGFYWKFARGRLDYMLSVHSFEPLVRHALDERRGVSEQILDLSPEQADRLYRLLMENYRPENRFYRYDFFYDNCATRLRDALSAACGQALVWPAERPSGKTLRQMLDVYVGPELELGFGLALGRPADHAATHREATFLPDSLAAYFGAARLNGRPLVRQTAVTLPVQLPPVETPSVPYTLWVGVAVAAVLGFGMLLRGGAKRLPLVTRVIVAAVGLLGCVIFFLTFLTDHAATAHNLNLLWAWPTHLVYALLSARWARHRAAGTYALITGGLTALICVGWLSLQALPLAAWPVAAALSGVLISEALRIRRG